MVLLIATEAAFFACLIAGYHYLRVAAMEWPPRGVAPPELMFPLINTVLLISSSLAYIWGERGIERNRLGRLRLGLLLAVLLGLAFLAIQVYEYSRSDLVASANSYSALFFAITGIHGLHVLVGVVMLAATLLWALGSAFDADRHAVVTNVGLYWHFVDAVWVVLIIPSIYLSPYL